MSRKKILRIIVCLLAIIGLGLLVGYCRSSKPVVVKPTPPPVVQPVVKQKPVKKVVSKPQVKATVVKPVETPCPPAKPATPTSITPQLQTAPSSICSEADNYYCARPLPQVVPIPTPARVPYQSDFGGPSQRIPDIQTSSAAIAMMQQPAKLVKGSSGGSSLNFNLFVNSSYYTSPRYGYGSTYGWTPGHEELKYDPRTGTYYRAWIAHPHPGYY